jgi:cytochrome c553
MIKTSNVVTCVALWAVSLPVMAQTQQAMQPLVAPVAGALPSWAYTVVPPDAVPTPDDGKPQRLPGSSVEYTWPEIRNLFSAKDWFPGELPPMPSVVSQGRRPDVFACGMCHYPNGQGKPENASIAGLPANYIVQQMADYKAGLRRSSEPRMMPPNRMLQVGKAATEEEAKAAAEYYSKLPYRPWIKVVETDRVPKTAVNTGAMLAVIPNGGTEPIGQRIIETAASLEDLERIELRDSRVGFVSYVPRGSIAKGEALASTGGAGKTIQCAICHGPDLKGLGDVPSLAGRSPAYTVRQLYDIQSGARNGVGAQLMKAVVQKLTLDDMIALAAYTGSREP